MLGDKVDWKRVALCCKTGRRFWTMCKVMRLYADINSYYKYTNVTFNPNACGLIEDAIEFSCNVDRSLTRFRNLEEFNFNEFFSFYDGSFYVNAVKFNALSSFQEYYKNIGLNAMSEEFVNMLYFSTVDHMPLEVRFATSHMVDNDGNVYGRKTYPLIFVLYKDDCMINFISKFTADLMMNPIYQIALLYGGLSGPDVRSFRLNCAIAEMFRNADKFIGMDLKKILTRS